MKKHSLLLAFLISSTMLFAQDPVGGLETSLQKLQSKKIDIEQRYASFDISKEEFESMKGSPYANESFIKGNIYQGKELANKNVLLRYNAFADEIEISKSKDSEEYSALIKDPDVYVKIFQDIYVFVPYKGSKEKGGYFNIVTEGNQFDLYKKAIVTYKEPYFAETSYQSDRPAEWVETITYYLVGKDGSFYELPTRRSKVLDVMKKKKKEVKKYIKEQNINLDEEQDLAELVTYFNSIL
ncbi:hypothetical protein [Marixanthomonas ophiurae]|uniref:GLPGLI family protein n=1 Tax=Marixanthomonas ophiurae TaxID=387659 RepID=A0A3E1QBV8_9FLAO|nr:hypothetical protein [Marixanthomonas ophiurae]RFN59622.1 hypothetical protein DZ858_06070 [Marixanthomonas ophiurae]